MSIARFCTLLLMFCIFNANNSFSQSNELDSLKSLLGNNMADSARYSLHIKIANKQLYDHPDEALVNARTALSLAVKSNNSSKAAESNHLMGSAFLQLNSPDSSVYRFQLALNAYKDLGLDKKIADVYNSFGNAYEYLNDFDTALVFYQQSLELSNSLGYEKGKADGYYFMGAAYNSIGDNSKALKFTLQALEMYKAQKRDKDLWYVMNILGVIYDDMGMYADALENNLNALELAEQSGEKMGLIIMCNNIAIVYNIIGNNEKALEYYNRAYHMSIELGTRENEALLLGNIATFKAEIGDTTEALQDLKDAIDIHLELGLKCDLPYIYDTKGDILAGLNEYDSAIYYLNEAYALSIECLIPVVQTSILRKLGKVHFDIGNKKQGIAHTKRALEVARSGSYANELKECLLQLYTMYNGIGNTIAALDYHVRYSQVGDSLFNIASADRIARLTAEFDFKKERELLELTNEKQTIEYNSEVKRLELLRNGILIILILAILFIITLGRSIYAIKNRNKKLTILNNEKNTLMGIVAHDLRSPVNNLKSLIPLLGDSSDDNKEERAYFLNLMNRSAERMSDMINRILDINAVEQMKINLELQPVDLGKILDQVVKNYKRLASKKHIKIHRSYMEQEYISMVDTRYLTQVYENLLSNAIKFSEESKNIYLSISTNNGNHEIVFKDEGPGISVEDQKRLFKKYTRLSSKPTANESSTGLGLSIVKKYVGAMGGTIDFDSELGAGTSFIVKFKDESH